MLTEKEISPAQKIMQDFAIEEKKTKVLRPYVFLVIFMFLTILGLFQMSHSSGVYYLFNDRPKYEDLFTLKGESVLIVRKSGKASVRDFSLGIKNRNIPSIQISDDWVYNLNNTEQYVGQKIEIKIDKFYIPYECKINDVPIQTFNPRIHEDKNETLVLLLLFFILSILPFLLLLAYAIKNHKKDFTINHD